MYEELIAILTACSNKKGHRCSECPAFGSGDYRSCGRKAMKNAAAALSALQSENAELTTVVKSYAVSARSIALWLRAYCDRSLPYDKMISDAAQKAASALSRMKAERDAAISDVPHDCEHCNHAADDGACKLLPDGDQFSTDYTEGFDRDGNCDHWEWRGAQEEGQDEN